MMELVDVADSKSAASDGMGVRVVLIYCRLAHNDSMAMECQKDYLRHWAAENGYTVEDMITEVGSGIQLDRPGLTEVMRAVQEKRMDALVVRKLSRLARRSTDARRLRRGRAGVAKQ
mgnify:CR=1 FL=1